MCRLEKKEFPLLSKYSQSSAEKARILLSPSRQHDRFEESRYYLPDAKRLPELPFCELSTGFYTAFGMWWYTVTHGWGSEGETGVGSQYSHTTSERGVSRITNTDAHTSAASSRLN